MNTENKLEEQINEGDNVYLPPKVVPKLIGGIMTKREKVRMYVEYTLGMSAKDLSSKYGVNVSNINYYIDLIKMHGIKILGDLDDNSNKKYSKNFRTRCAKRVVEGGESAYFVSLDAGLSNTGLIYQWIEKYKQKLYNIKKGKPRRSRMSKKELSNNEKAELKALRERNEYLEAENEYLKKLDVLMKEKDRQAKKRRK